MKKKKSFFWKITLVFILRFFFNKKISFYSFDWIISEWTRSKVFPLLCVINSTDLDIELLKMFWFFITTLKIICRKKKKRNKLQLILFTFKWMFRLTNPPFNNELNIMCFVFIISQAIECRRTLNLLSLSRCNQWICRSSNRSICLSCFGRLVDKFEWEEKKIEKLKSKNKAAVNVEMALSVIRWRNC